MRLLPTDLSALSDVTGDNTRFSTAAVHLVLHGDNTYVAEATDCKVAVRVTGPLDLRVDLARRGDDGRRLVIPGRHNHLAGGVGGDPRE